MIEYDHEKVAHLLLNEGLPDILRRAESGDVAAAREAIGWMAKCLSPRSQDSVPDCVREYLSCVLTRVANGEDLGKAFNVSRNARPRTPELDKRLGAYLVWQAREYHDPPRHTVTIEEASLSAAEHLNDLASRNELRGRWQSFNGKRVHEKTLAAWYAEKRDFLDSIHKASIKTKNSENHGDFSG